MDKTKTQDITFRVFSVIIAFMLWMVVTAELNPIRSYQITNIPVKLVGTDALEQQGLVLIDSEETISLTVKGRNSDVLALKPTDFKVEADLGNGYRVKGNNSVLVSIKEYPRNIEIPSQPIYVTVELDELVQKSFPITVKANIRTKDGYVLEGGVNYSPKEAILRGASRYIGSVDQVIATFSEENVTDDISTSLALQALDKNGVQIRGIEIIPTVVDITSNVYMAKEVPVNLRQKGKLPDGVFMKDIKVVPEKITLVGEENVLSGIESVSTDTVNLSDVTDTTTKTVNLILPSGVKTSNGSSSVRVDINVETTISKTFNVPVSITNLPEGLKADIVANNTISVTVSGRESLINALQASNISAVVDLSNAGEGERDFEPKITVPEGFKVIGVDPSNIKINITKKQ